MKKLVKFLRNIFVHEVPVPVPPVKSLPEKPDYHFRAVGGGVFELRDGPPIDPKLDRQYPFDEFVP